MSDELSPDARSIIDAGRAGDDPTEADRARVRAALMISLAGGAGAAAAAAAARLLAMIDASTPAMMKPAMIPSDSPLEMWTWPWPIILAPMNISRPASAYLR